MLMPHHVRYTSIMSAYLLEHFNGRTFFLQLRFDSNAAINLASDTSKLHLLLVSKPINFYMKDLPKEMHLTLCLFFLEHYNIIKLAFIATL